MVIEENFRGPGSDEMWYVSVLTFRKYSDTSANEDNSFRNHIR